MKEADDVIIIWPEEGSERDVSVAGEFSNWQPLSMSRSNDGLRKLR